MVDFSDLIPAKNAAVSFDDLIPKATPPVDLDQMQRDAMPSGVDMRTIPTPTVMPAAPEATPRAATPFDGEGVGPLLERRGQQFARGATETIAALPEAAALAGLGNPNNSAQIAQDFVTQAQEQITAANERLELYPDMNAEDRSRISAVIAQSQKQIEAYQPIVDIAVGPLTPNPSDVPLFKMGDRLRDASSEMFGVPDSRDESFWAAVAEGGGNMTGMVMTSVAAGLVGGPVAALAAGGSQGAAMNTSSMYTEALDAGANEQTARDAAKWGALIGASEIVPINRALKLLPPRLRNSIGQGFFRKFSDIAQSSGEEAAQEYLATVANNIVAQNLYDPTRGWTEGAVEGALVGAVLGGGVGAVGVASNRESPLLTDSDRSSPISNDIIGKGKDLVEGLLNPSAAPVAPVGLSPVMTAETSAEATQQPETPVADASPVIPSPIAAPPQQAVAEPAPPVDSDFEIIPEVEGEDFLETGRMVRIDRNTGKATVVESPEPVADAEIVDEELPPISPQNSAPVADAGIASEELTPIKLLDSAPTEATPKGIVELTGDDVLAIGTDATTFQYKSGGDQDGVTDRLRDVREWDSNRAGVALVYEYADGRRVIVDGHQRLGLAKRSVEAGQTVDLPVRILRETDGITPEMARVRGAEKNIAEGSGTAIDAAKIMRDTGRTAREMNLPMSGVIVRDSDGLSKLSNDAFGMVVNEVAPIAYGATVGRLVSDSSVHSNILGMLVKLNPANAVQVESIVRQASQATVTETQDSLFGSEDVSENLYLERAKVLDRVLKDLGQNINTFKTLTTRGDEITGAGNKLDQDANTERLSEDEQSKADLVASANMKGATSDALTEAAKFLKGGGKVGVAATRFIQAIRRGNGQNKDTGSGRRDSGSSDGPSQTESQQEVTPAINETTDVPPDPRDNRDLNYVDTGGSYGKKRTYPGFVLVRSPKGRVSIHRENESAIIGSTSLDGIPAAMSRYENPFTGERFPRPPTVDTPEVDMFGDPVKAPNEPKIDPDADNADGGMFGDLAKDDGGKGARDKAEVDARSNQSKSGRAGGNSGAAGALFDTDQSDNAVDAEPAEKAPAPAGLAFSGPRADDTSSLTIEEQDRLAQLRAQMRDKFKTQLNAGLDPELVAIAAEMGSIYIKAGARKFRDLLRAMIEDLGLSFAQAQPYARGAYNQVRDDMDLNGDDINGMDTSDEVLAQVKAMRKEAETNVPSTSSNVEPDSGSADVDNTVGAANVPSTASRPSNSTGQRGSAPNAPSGISETSGGLSQGDADGVGAGGNSSGSGRTRTKPGTAADQDSAGSRDLSKQGLPDDEGGAKDTERHAKDNAEVGDRASQQAKADKIKVVPSNEKNIRDTLPLLLPEQQDDVLKIEQRFAKPDGHGMLITNGTGTGKTYTGLGAVKRLAMQGKTNSIIVAPSQGILDGWIEAGADLGLTITKLTDTSTAGDGIVATTYANLSDNPALAMREWDLVVADESDNLMSNAAGEPTTALDNLRAITNRPSDLYKKVSLQNAEELARLYPDQEGKPRRATDAVEAQRRALDVKMKSQRDAMEGATRSKVLFLSATPFAYDKNVDYAEGYLFDYPSDGTTDSGSRQSGRNFFMVENFGYRIRYHKLTKPEAAVDSGVFEREMHEKLKRQGVLSGRSLDIDADYDRKFVKVQDVSGERIDEALDFIRDKSDNTVEGREWRELGDHVSKNFNYLRRMQLLEAIKAKAAIPDIKKHLALGRKIVVFHDYNVGGGFNPFTSSDKVIPTKKAMKAYKRLVAEKPWVTKLDFAGYGAPIDTLTAAFGSQAVTYNGRVSGKQRKANKDAFNKDGSGVDLMIVQSDAGKSGLSLHDVTGEHQRVLINLGMPTKPTTTLQEEGRIRRVGSVSDAAFRYYTIGTTWERTAFAQRIAGQSSTVENLAMGNEARTIRDGFINAYMDADVYEPSAEDGKGGKDADRSQASVSPYDIAKTHYFGRMKNTRSRGSRQGVDFYATPEPIGMKMAQWIMAGEYERVLEPSAGDGAIARYLPADTDRTIIEPSNELLSQAQLRSPGARGLNETFEDHHVINKYNAVVMNPPYGSGGKTAMEHLEKAMRHTSPGGRVVALIPQGPAAGKRFDAMYDGEFGQDFAIVGEILLPSITFTKANTGVMTRIVIIDRLTADETRADVGFSKLDLTHIEKIDALFDAIEDVDAPPRAVPPVEEIAITTEAPAVGADVDASAFDVFQFFHSKTGKNKHAVQLVERVGKDRFKEIAAIARANGGYYSSYSSKADDIKPGFLFDNPRDRARFMEDLQKPIVSKDQAAFHGTPHDFDAFSLSEMGTGEGVQAYGWGMYFAGRRGIAEHYRDVLSKGGENTIKVDGKVMLPIDAANVIRNKSTPRMASFSKDVLLYPNFLVRVAAFVEYEKSVGGKRTELELTKMMDDLSGPKSDRFRKWAKEIIAEVTGYERASSGKLFTVDVPENSDLLNWNATLEDQSDTIKAALKNVPDSILEEVNRELEDRGQNGFDSLDEMTGADLVKYLSNPGIQEVLPDEVSGSSWFDGNTSNEKHTSMYLRSIGIVGHRFLDGPSRKKGEGTSNYVIYDDAAVKVVSKELAPGSTAIEPTIAADLMPALRAKLDSMMLKNVRLGVDTRGGRQGAFTVDGLGEMDILIGQSLNPEATLYHESVHAMKQMDLFTDNEWGALSAEASAKWMAKHDIEARYPNLDRDAQIEEAIAEEFGAWASGSAKQSGAIAGAFSKMKRIMQAIRNAAKGLGFQTAEDIFGKALSGEIGSRAAGNTGGALSRDQATSSSEIDAFSKELIERLGLRSLSMFMSRDDLKVMMIAVNKEDQGSGVGTKAMQEITDFADENGLRIKLSPGLRDDGFGTTSRNRLLKFYKRFGFVENKGRNKDFTISEGMYREPTSTKDQAMPRKKPATGAMQGGAFIPDRGVWDALTDNNTRLFARLGNTKAAMADQVDRARITLQDRMLPILRAQEAVERETGLEVQEANNAYLAEETFSGKVGRHLFEIDEQFTKPIIDIIGASKDGITVDSVGEWLTARHAVERNAYIASINDQMPDGGSGMINADAQQILADAKAGPHGADLQAIGDMMDKLRERNVALRVDAGLMTQEQADLWGAQYKHYVPLKGWAETDHADAQLQASRSGPRFNIRGQESKQALGRSSEAFNPLQAMLTQSQEVAIRAEKNRVANAMYRLAKENPAPAMWEVKTPKSKRYFNKSTGLVETRIDQPIGMIIAPNEMAVKVDGVEHRLLFNDERLARSMGSIGADQMGAALRIASGFSRYISSINTMMSPEFTVTNAFRDITAASINIRSFGKDDKNRIGKAMVRDWRKALAGAYGGMRGKADTEWQKHYAEFEKAGGKVSFWIMDQPEAGKADLEKRIGLAHGSKARRLSKFVRPSIRDNPALKFIENANMAVDNAVRLAAFVEARKAGWTSAQAASLSKNLTVNFNRRGEAGPVMNALWTFSNASIQGNAIILKALRAKPVQRAAVGIFASSVVLDLINAALSEEDEDGELAYDKIPDFKGRRNLILNIAGGDNPITVPLPYGWSLFSYGGQQVGKVMRGVKSPGDSIGDVLAASFETFSPMGSGSLLQILTPTALDPIMEMAINEDWLGRPIRPESPYNDYGPNAYKAYNGVRATSAAISDGLNRATGGSRAESGAIDVSPEYLDHAFNFIAGGAGRFVGDITDIGGKLATGHTDEIRSSAIPFAGNVGYETGAWLDTDRYYRFSDRVRSAQEAYSLHKETGAWVSNDTRALVILGQRLKLANRAMTALRKDRREMLASDRLNQAEKRSAREQFAERESRIVLGFNGAFVAEMGRQGE